MVKYFPSLCHAAAATKLFQSCPTLCDPIGSRRQPTRLPRPWDSPSKNTGVGCHFLLQCMKVKSEREVAQLCPTLHDPMDCSLPGSSVHGIFQASELEWGAIAIMSNSFETPWTVAHQAPLSMGFPRQEHWSGVPLPSPPNLIVSFNFIEPPENIHDL